MPYTCVLVMRMSGFFPTRGSRFYEIICPAPARPAPLYLFFNPPRPTFLMTRPANKVTISLRAPT